MSLIIVSAVDKDVYDNIGEPYSALIDTDNIFIATEGEDGLTTVVLIHPATGDDTALTVTDTISMLFTKKMESTC